MYETSEPETIQALFASIAENYDRMNVMQTFGLHKRWNQSLIETLKNRSRLLDLCAGTGEIAFGFLKQNPTARAILLDFCPEMLAIAQSKGASFLNRFELVQADAQAIPLPHHSVDAVTISYGIRNVKEITTCFQEVYRVLAPGGSFGILELTRPTSWFFKTAHLCYTKAALPLLGKFLTKNKEAYRYLANSIQNFTSPEVLEEIARQTGFHAIQRRSLTFGTVTLLTMMKK